jgi:hypothetical protein
MLCTTCMPPADSAASSPWFHLTPVTPMTKNE